MAVPIPSPPRKVGCQKNTKENVIKASKIAQESVNKLLPAQTIMTKPTCLQPMEKWKQKKSKKKSKKRRKGKDITGPPINPIEAIRGPPTNPIEVITGPPTSNPEVITGTPTNSEDFITDQPSNAMDAVTDPPRKTVEIIMDLPTKPEITEAVRSRIKRKHAKMQKSQSWRAKVIIDPPTNNKIFLMEKTFLMLEDTWTRALNVHLKIPVKVLLGLFCFIIMYPNCSDGLCVASVSVSDFPVILHHNDENFTFWNPIFCPSTSRIFGSCSACFERKSLLNISCPDVVAGVIRVEHGKGNGVTDLVAMNAEDCTFVEKGLMPPDDERPNGNQNAPPVPTPKQPYYFIPNQTLNIKDMVTTGIPFPEWQLCHFNITNRAVIHQYVTIKNMGNRDSPDCTFNITALPFWYNCSQAGYLVFMYNETCIEMATKDLSTNDYSLEYGTGRNGDNLQATRGERLDAKKLEDKIARITKTTYTTPQERTPGDTDYTAWIAVGVGVGLLATCIVLISLYKFCKSFQRWVQSLVSSCRTCNTKNVPETDANHKIEMEPLASPTTNGSVNGHLGNQEKGLNEKHL